MSRTKVVAVFGLIASVGVIGKDIFDGGGFNFTGHFTEIAGVLGCLGLFFLRDAIQKIINVIKLIK